MTQRNCPVCETSSARARVRFQKNIDQRYVTSASFASRKMPEFMSHRLVHCPVCDLIYADDPPDQYELNEAYREAAFDSGAEAEDAAKTYAETLDESFENIPRRGAALEIGAGTGAFLSKLVERGFQTVIGVEPSLASIASAAVPERRLIREGAFRASDFEPQSFDLICCFMTLEHVRDPCELLNGCYDLLRPGGSILLVTHDHRATLNRVLGRRSPIIDIEHMQLFSSLSLKRALEMSGFDHVSVHSFRNRYRLNYWCRLLPLPLAMKSFLMRFLRVASLGNVKVSLNVGNIMGAATRPLAT